VAGTRLRDIAPKVGTAEDTEDWEKVHKDVINRCTFAHHSLTRTHASHDSITVSRRETICPVRTEQNITGTSSVPPPSECV